MGKLPRTKLSRPEQYVQLIEKMAGTTGLEPATSDVTGRRSNQLNYVPASLSETPE